MPIIVQRETERGDAIEVADRVDALLTAVERVGSKRFAMLRYIDPYGDTTFNQPMLPDVLKDLDQLLALAITPDERTIAEQLRRMAERCLGQVHEYLKFLGD